jgi:hypothetical protein
MLFVLLSPAKKLDFGPMAPAVKATQPALMKDTAILAARAKALTAREIARLMDVSAKLAELNVQRFQAFDPANRGETRPAVFAFAGEVYQGLAAKTLSADDLAFAQAHVGILSGLYGLLRPLDAIQPYRLEMGSALKTERGRDLHAFWRDTLTAHLNKRLAKLTSPTVVNLASDEYYGALDASKIAAGDRARLQGDQERQAHGAELLLQEGARTDGPLHHPEPPDRTRSDQALRP